MLDVNVDPSAIGGIQEAFDYLLTQRCNTCVEAKGLINCFACDTAGEAPGMAAKSIVEMMSQGDEQGYVSPGLDLVNVLQDLTVLCPTVGILVEHVPPFEA